MKPIAQLTFAILGAFMLLAACSDSEPSDAAFLSDIVTVETTGPDGTRFTFRRYDDSPLILLDDPEVTVKEEFVGKRVLLRYYPSSGEPYVSGAIRAVGLTAINNDTAVVRPVERYDWNADAVYLNSIWRSGPYINVNLRATYSPDPRYFSLMVDSLTLTDPVPQLYLVHNLLGAHDNYMSQVYASFDISNVWSRPACLGIDIHVNDSNLKTDVYSFFK